MTVILKQRMEKGGTKEKISQMFCLTGLAFFKNIAELKPLQLNSKKAVGWGGGRAL